jgi:hypothetical protein
MLYSDAMGNTSDTGLDDDAYSAIRFGEVVYSTIRRFVVVGVRQGFVYAWWVARIPLEKDSDDTISPISTYSNRGTLKPGCDPSAHAIIYFSGIDPQSCYLQGEVGMTTEPVEVVPADSSLVMKPKSRIRFSKTIPVEMNVKVKDIGRVHSDHMSNLASCWQIEFNRGSGDSDPVTKPQVNVLEWLPAVERKPNDDHQIQVQSDEDDNRMVGGLEDINSKLIGDLRSGL